MNFYISITTIRKYKPALDILLCSLPIEWRNRYILVYQNEEETSIDIFKDGHIEVCIENNLSDYGNWIGVYLLFAKKIIPDESWILFIHDTCKFKENALQSTYNLLKIYKDTDYDIVWLTNDGRCNICLIRKNAIEYGFNIYKNIKEMTKMETIKCEWEHDYELSPKSFKVKQDFIKLLPLYLGKKFIYNLQNERNIFLFQAIDMEKYYVYVKEENQHPKMP